MKVNLEKALERLQEARAGGSEEAVAAALFEVGVAYQQQQRPEAAERSLAEAYEICGRLGNHTGQGRVRMQMAELTRALGMGELVYEHLEHALEHFRQGSDISGLANALEKRARLRSSQGDAAGAVTDLEEALQLARDSGDQLSQLLLQQYLAPLYRRLDQAENALKAYRQLGALSQELGEPQHEALALVGVGTLLAQGGDKTEGQRALTKAQELFASLGQTQRAEQVEMEIKRLGLDGPA